MPEICRFYGLIIKMFYKDHLPAHFHVEYGDFEGTVDIHTMELIEGELPNRLKC